MEQGGLSGTSSLLLACSRRWRAWLHPGVSCDTRHWCLMRRCRPRSLAWHAWVLHARTHKRTQAHNCTRTHAHTHHTHACTIACCSEKPECLALGPRMPCHAEGVQYPVPGNWNAALSMHGVVHSRTPMGSQAGFSMRTWQQRASRSVWCSPSHLHHTHRSTGAQPAWPSRTPSWTSSRGTCTRCL